MPITDIKLFSDKYYGKPIQSEDIARLENISLTEVNEALTFLRDNSQITWPLKVKGWSNLQYANTHPSTGPSNPAVFGPTPATGGKRKVSDLTVDEFTAILRSEIERAG